MIDKKKLGKRNRNKGLSFERELCAKLKFYFPDAMTARAGDRSQDSQGKDLLNTGCFNFQCKSSVKFPNPAPILSEMPQDTNFNILAVKIKSKGNYIVMSEQDFLEIVGILKANGIL